MAIVNYTGVNDLCMDMDSSPEKLLQVCHQIGERVPSLSVIPRKLKFGSPEDNKSVHSSTIKSSISPPYRKVRALRLFDSPATPKTIIQKCAGKTVNHLAIDISSPAEGTDRIDRPKALPLHTLKTQHAVHTANVNPFTPNNLLSHKKKRCRTQLGGEVFSSPTLQLQIPGISNHSEDENSEIVQAPKRLALQDTNISRYKKEFVEISLIGVGEFGLVYQCLNRLDGCIYAIKKSIKPVAGSSFEKRALNEVWAHAVLGKHDNVVRYYSAWAEDNHMLIQNEFCNGGSLQSVIQKRVLNEMELKTLLLHIAEGLKYIHSNDLVHMDLKAGNIFLTTVPAKPQNECFDLGLDDIYDELNSECLITYKIGDLGHVTSCKDAHVEEGDCRYLPNEVLQEDFRYLFKADIFSLGITLYEAAGGGPLPKNGPDWHKLRNGEFPNIPTLSDAFNDLIKLMTHPDPEKRPTSTTIFNHPVLSSLESKSKSQLAHELTIERKKNDILLRKLKEVKSLLKNYQKIDSNSCSKLKTRKANTPRTNNRQLRSREKTNDCSIENFHDSNKNLIFNF